MFCAIPETRCNLNVNQRTFLFDQIIWWLRHPPAFTTFYLLMISKMTQCVDIRIVAAGYKLPQAYLELSLPLQLRFMHFNLISQLCWRITRLETKHHWKHQGDGGRRSTSNELVRQTHLFELSTLLALEESVADICSSKFSLSRQNDFTQVNNRTSELI